MNKFYFKYNGNKIKTIAYSIYSNIIEEFSKITILSDFESMISNKVFDSIYECDNDEIITHCSIVNKKSFEDVELCISVPKSITGYNDDIEICRDCSGIGIIVTMKFTIDNYKTKKERTITDDFLLLIDVSILPLNDIELPTLSNMQWFTDKVTQYEGITNNIETYIAPILHEREYINKISLHYLYCPITEIFDISMSSLYSLFDFTYIVIICGTNIIKNTIDELYGQYNKDMVMFSNMRYYSQLDPKRNENTYKAIYHDFKTVYNSPNTSKFNSYFMLLMHISNNLAYDVELTNRYFDLNLNTNCKYYNEFVRIFNEVKQNKR